MVIDPVVAVHLAILYDVVCHSCGWEAGPFDRRGDAEGMAEAHLEDHRRAVRSDLVAGVDVESNTSLRDRG